MLIMRPLALFGVALALGAADALLTGLLGVIAGGAFFVLALPLARKGDIGAALAGLLGGFGAVWLALMARQTVTGGRLDDPVPWLVLGAVPLILGVAIGAVRLATSRRAPPSSPGRPSWPDPAR